MNKEKMNRAIGMLDDDVLADALEGKKRSTGGVTRRKLAIMLIAATLAVALLAGGIIAALTRGAGGPLSILPPEDATVIRNVITATQVTSGTVYASGYYPSVSVEFSGTPAEEYALINELEISRELYDGMVASNDPDRIWALEVSISPNLYMSDEYVERELSYWMSKAEAEDLSALAVICEQLKNDFDIEALYEANKDKYELDEIYKYFSSGKLEEALLNNDVDALKAQAEALWSECINIKNGYWSSLAPAVRRALDDFGIDYVQDNEKFIIFVTEGELLSLQGFSGVKISKASEYGFDFGQMPTATEWNGKLVSNKLADALAANEGNKDALFAVTVEPAAFSKLCDRAGYEARYLELFAEAAKRPAYRAALEAAAADVSKMQTAIELCGESMVAEYIKDGVFDAAGFDEYTVKLNESIEVMRSNLYRDASEIYAEFAPLVRYIEINSAGNMVFYVTADELAALVTEREYCFKLAS